MYCKNCGANVPSDAEVCPECNSRQLGGKNIPKNTVYYTPPADPTDSATDPAMHKTGKYCKNCGAAVPGGAEACPECNSRQLGGHDIPKATVDYDPTTDPAAYKMGWYKFIIRVPLLIGGILGIILGIMYAMGVHYYGYADTIYAAFPELRFLDIFLGVGTIAYSILGFYTRHRLVNFRKNGPTLLMVWYICGIGTNLVHTIGEIAILPSTLTGGSSILTGIVGPLGMLVINKIYFDNRKALFVY